MKKLLLLLIAVLLFACNGKESKSRIINPDASQKILISMESTEFKEKLVDKLISKYKNISTIEIQSLKFLKKTNPADYNAIIILDACQASLKLNFVINKFRKNHPTEDNVIFFITSGDPDWKWNDPDVRAITSASEFNLLDKTFLNIKTALDSLLK